MQPCPAAGVVGHQWGADRPARRLPQLFAGLILYGASMALMIRSRLGLNPWGVFHQGLALRTGWSFGHATIVVAATVLLLWIPLRQRPGVGTVSNVLIIGLAVDATLAVLPPLGDLTARVLFLVAGVALNGLASACYIGAGLGPGPRDGLMTAWAARSGRSLRGVRTGIEVVVLAVGWFLGGTVGIGTVVYALSIGPLVQFLLPHLSVDRKAVPRATPGG